MPNIITQKKAKNNQLFLENFTSIPSINIVGINIIMANCKKLIESKTLQPNSTIKQDVKIIEAIR